MADSDEERSARDEQMRKLRMSGSSSPSALSTASSGSPLVRNSSGASQQRANLAAGRRVAPTSIAAAQLQQQLEFTNRLPASRSEPHQQQQQQPANQRKDSKMPKGSSWPTKDDKDGGALASGKKRHKLAASAKLDNSASAAAQKQAQAAREQNGAERHKSLGYNVAKSIAFRVYRVNEFWTVNKMRYMNLACLLMTLVCLVTILLFAGSNNNNNSNQPDAIDAARLLLKNQQLQELAEEAESVDAANSQPLVAAAAPNSSEAASGASQQEASFDEPADEQRPSKVARKSGALAKTEREVEETTTPSSGDNQADKAGELAGIVEPLLGQLLQDLELGPLFKAVRRAAGNSSLFGKPLVKRTRNGATIIFSASSAPLNQTAAHAGSSFPALLQRLLPPLFRAERPASNGSAAGGGGQLATITIGAEPMVLASSRLAPFGEPPGAEHARPSSLFMGSDPFGFRAPFALGPLFGPGPLVPMMAPLGPPPGLLSMLMRASAAAANPQPDSDDAEGPFARFPVAVVAAPASARNESSSQAAGGNSTGPAPANATAESAGSSAANQSKSSPDSEVETFDVSQLKPAASRAHAHTLYPARASTRPHSAGSMLIFSSGGLEALPARDPFQFPFGAMMSPFMGAAPPQMMLIGGGGGGGGGDRDELAPSSGPLNPILRSILSNVMLDSVAPPGGDADKNKTERNKAEASRAASSQPGSSWSELDDDWPHGNHAELERWDERPGAEQAPPSSGKQLRARHRQASAELEAESALEQVDHSDSMGPQYAESAAGPNARFHEGVVQGTIRQTIRGPGMTVERIIEMPANRIVREQVGPGVRSQSLSRADFADEDTPPAAAAMSVRPAASAFMNPFGRAMSSTAQSLAAERADSSDTFMGPPAGFIGKLLADIARRSERAEARSSSGGHKSRLLAFNEDDFDEADSLSEPAPSGNLGRESKTLLPKIRVASARVRVRPAHMAAASGVAEPPAFFAPPAHFTMAAAGENSPDNDKEAGPAPASGLFAGFGDASKLASSFEDTMNSMEDRLNHVLSMAGVNPSASKQQQQRAAEEQQAAELASKAQPAPSASRPPAHADPKQQQQQAAAAADAAEQKQVSAAFTSPSSPLFGFPALPQAANNNNNEPAKQEAAPRAAQKQAPSGNNNRQQRSFTYHSNNEIAKPLLPAANQQHQLQHQQHQQHHHHHHHHQQQQQQQARAELPLAAAESSAQPKFIPLSSASASVFGPPARLVLGRRLDEQVEQLEPANAELSGVGGNGQNALVGRAFRPHSEQQQQQQVANLQENYRTIVV